MRADEGRRIPLAGRVLVVASALLGATGCDARIEHPEALWLLWLVPAVGLFYLFSFRRSDRLLRRFAAPELLPRLTARLSRSRQVFKAFLVLVALAAALLALAGLQYGFTWEEVTRRGVDVVIVIDVSDSMLVSDVERGGDLSRLERARREVADLLDIMEGDRVGLVAFAGTAFLQCPLTLDYSAVSLFLDGLEPDLIPVKGTAIAEALEVALGAFDPERRSSRAIILITDGEDHEGEVLEVAARAAEQGVRIFPIGVGRVEGSPIPREGRGFRRDASGEIILSRLDETTLQRVALETGGRYVRSVTGDMDLEQIYSQGIKATLEDTELGSRRRQRWEDRFQWLLALAAGALMLEALISERRRRRDVRQS
jgi:Ca-activated chloride channel family protein